jgi:ppGpp synthetase/RelA/SpoT-type nucleotidyltranferase
MQLIDDFLARYRREFDFYDQAARLLAQQLDTDLQASGIRAMVTARAKQPIRLEAKVRQRAVKKEYDSVDAIFADIVDLAGVRIALYFPAEREEVGKLVQARCTLVEPAKTFPTSVPPTYTKRFSGYWATHYRVRMLEASLTEPQKRYADARIEVQVASVLMHAWSEVEHDLVYKPLVGVLSDEEYAILDELNGMVLAGEIALERLQKAGESRVAKTGRVFTNHFDLAAYLLEQVKPILSGAPPELALGRVDVLFDFLSKIGLARPDAIESYLQALSPDVETRPIADQIADQLLAADSTRYPAYTEIREERERKRSFESASEVKRSDTQHEALGKFVANWVTFETIIRDAAGGAKAASATPTLMPTRKLLIALNALDEIGGYEAERLRNFRNALLHGASMPNAEFILDQAEAVAALNQRLKESPNIAVRKVARRILKTRPAKRTSNRR